MGIERKNFQIGVHVFQTGGCNTKTTGGKGGCEHEERTTG